MASTSVVRPSPLRSSMTRTFGSLRHRNFRLLWTGNIATQAGYWMFGVAQGWLVLDMEKDNQAFWLGIVGFAGGLPLLLFSLFGGVLADRFNRKKLLLTYQIFSALFITVFAILVSLKIAQIWHVLIIAFLFGSMMSLNIPLRQSLVPTLVEKDDLLNATALNAVGFNAMRVVGPSLAGILITTIGTLGIFWLMAVCYIWAVLWVVQMDEPAPVTQQRDVSPLKNLTDGLRFIRHEKNILSLLFAVTMPTIFVLPYLNLVPLFARNILQVGATGLGLMEGAVGSGALIAALVVASMGYVRRKGMLMVVVIVSYSILVALFGLSSSFILSLVILALSGIAWSVLNSINSTLIQITTPDEYRGRVFSVYSLTWGLQPLGNLLIGGLADAVGAPFAIAFGGMVSAVASLALAWLNPRMRNMD
jgi:MFS family permease